ncbi:MAG: PQQ-binding-like beta-propeller repeat protein [Candidatus Bathyarchaeota archaeon]|nr:PQQ-binding-like beta-propeller repeat protein [Candidatus Bathyarchaeota archaeon]
MGIAPENATPPIDFGTDKNVLWKIETPEGLSSPIFIGDNLVITGVNRDDKEFLIWNINSDNGEIRWRKKVAVEDLEQVHPTSSPAVATPASDGEFIYCYFPSFGLVCYDFEGNRIWDKPIEFQQVISGSGTSPIIHKDKLILNYDNLIEPRLIVFNKSTGDLLWEHHFPISPIVSSASWSTPVIWNDQVIIHRSNRVEGVDIHTGQTTWQYDIGTMGEATPVIIEDTLYVNAWIVRGEKAFWGEVDDFQKLFTEIDIDNDSVITQNEFKNQYPKGIAINDRTEAHEFEFTTFYIYWGMVKDFDYNEDEKVDLDEWRGLVNRMEDFADHGLVAIQLGGTGNINMTSQLWKVPDDIPETPSIIVNKGLIYMTKNGGTTTCINANNGNIIYREKLGATGAYFASPILANSLIYYASYNGKITIVKEGEQFEIVNQIDLDERIGASPVALEDKLYVRTASHLYAFK